MTSAGTLRIERKVYPAEINDIPPEIPARLAYLAMVFAHCRFGNKRRQPTYEGGAKMAAGRLTAFRIWGREDSLSPDGKASLDLMICGQPSRRNLPCCVTLLRFRLAKNGNDCCQDARNLERVGFRSARLGTLFAFSVNRMSLALHRATSNTKVAVQRRWIMNLLSRFGGRIWDPWREIGQLQNDMSRMLAGARAYGGFDHREFPPVNLYVNDHDLLLTLEIAGIDPSKVDVTVTGDTVNLRGERLAEAAQPGESFHRRERPVGQFSREVRLPFEVDPSKTEASYERGVLTVRMARPESVKPRKVTVKSA
jgi:HSP20 family protein